MNKHQGVQSFVTVELPGILIQIHKMKRQDQNLSVKKL